MVTDAVDIDSLDDALRTSVHALQLQAASELATARTLIGVSSSVSLVAALAMVACFVAFEESRRCGRRLLLCLHISDACAACMWLLALALPNPGSESSSRNDSAIADTIGTEVQSSSSSSMLCHTQAYALLFFALASSLWTACFAFHLFQLLGRQRCKTAPELYETRYHIIAWGVPLLAVLHLALQQLLGYDLVGESGLPWCWVRTWSDLAWAPTGVLVQLGAYYGPVLLVLLHNVSTYLALLQQLQRDDISSAMELQICTRMVAYTCAFVFAVVWGFAGLLYQAFTPEHSLAPALVYTMSFFAPLQGAMNTAAYGVNKKLRHRVARALSRMIKS